MATRKDCLSGLKGTGEHMKTTEAKVMEGSLRVTYTDTALERAWEKYPFNFKVDGVLSHATYDHLEKQFYVECPENGAELLGLSEQVERIVSESSGDLDQHDVRIFLS